MKQIWKLEAVELLNGLVFFSPVSLLVRTMAGISLSEFFVLQAILSFVILIFEIPTGALTDKIGYRNSIILSQVLLFFSRGILFVSYVTGNFWIFVIEAFIEGISACFMSGTKNAYLYSNCEESEYASLLAKVTNFGTAGFIISTITYVFLYNIGGIEALLVATIIACALAIPFTFILAKEEEIQSKEKSIKIRTSDFFKDRVVVAVVLFTAVLSICGLVINFFYVDRLIEIGINERWMSLIIIVYSLFQMLAERILNAVSEKKYNLLMLLCSVAVGGMMTIFALSNAKYLIVAIMVIMPLFLDIPIYIQDELINSYIDKHEQQERRATILSVINMSGNILEIVFLLASAYIAGLGISLCYIVTAVLIVIFAVIVFVMLGRKASYDERTNAFAREETDNG